MINIKLRRPKNAGQKCTLNKPLYCPKKREHLKLKTIAGLNCFHGE
jgi:hypothetical protein